MSVTIAKGSILIYRAFDIAEEINLTKAERLLSAYTSEKIKYTRLSKQGIIINNAPLRFSLGESVLEIAGSLIQTKTFAKIWDYGVVSIMFNVPVPENTSWDDLLKISSALDQQTPSNNDVDTVAIQRCTELSTVMKDSLTTPIRWVNSEDYSIYYIEKLGGVSSVKDFVTTVDIPALIYSESKQGLSARSREALLEHSFQYREEDLVVVDWNSALLIDPSGQFDVADILEFALTHLLEMRYYDDIIDKNLRELYRAVTKKSNFFQRMRFSAASEKLSNNANRTYIELSEFLERVENSLKMVGDAYLARVFRSAVNRFRLSDWQGSIARKMRILAQVSELIQGEVNTRKSHGLEIIVILLILIEVVKAFL